MNKEDKNLEHNLKSKFSEMEGREREAALFAQSEDKFEQKLPIAETVKNIPLLSPRELYKELESLGYRGQEEARRAVCLSAYRHVRRVKAIYVEKVDRRKLPSRSNYLLVGPTGVGKTHIIELLYGHILHLPFVIVDATDFTEAGYVGEDVNNMLARLLHVARGDAEVAQCGVIGIDEVDKIAGGQSNARFAGEGTTKDVSGYGVQRELLKMLDGAKVRVPLDYGYSKYGPATMVDTSDIVFFGIGTFSGIADIGKTRSIGFIQDVTKNTPKGKIAYLLTKEESEDLTRFQKYGLMPELLGRFHRLIPFKPLGEETLRDIFEVKFRKLEMEFAMEGYKLRLMPGAADFIIQEAIERETGARAIDSVLTQKLEDTAFDLFGQNKQGEIIITPDKGDISCLVKHRA